MSRIFAISDATGVTAERVVRAALTQFQGAEVSIIRYGGIREAEQIHHIVAEAARTGGFIVHTFVGEDQRLEILNVGRVNNVTTIDLMGPLLARLSELLLIPPSAQPGLFNPFDSSYLQRIDAIDFTVRHDDGRNISDLYQAEIVLVGVSRTSKTPISIYLAYRGWKVANIPIILGVEPPSQLFKLPHNRVAGLVVIPERLAELRRVRAERMGVTMPGYADLEHVRQEVAYAYQLFDRRRDWPLIDVTTKPLEEAASEVVTLLGRTSRESDPNF